MVRWNFGKNHRYGEPPEESFPLLGSAGKRRLRWHKWGLAAVDENTNPSRGIGRPDARGLQCVFVKPQPFPNGETYYDTGTKRPR